MRKVGKTYQFSLCIVWKMILWFVEQWRGLIQPCGSNPAGKVENFIGDQVGRLLGCHERRWESLREEEILVCEWMKKWDEGRGFFREREEAEEIERKWKDEEDEENEKKKKKRLVIVKKMKRRERHLVTKLHVI